MLGIAGQTTQTYYHSISGKILPHFYVNIIFLAQKLTKLSVILVHSRTQCVGGGVGGGPISLFRKNPVLYY